MNSDWLRVDELQVGHLYRLDARRQSFGVWNGGVFVGVQWEFGSRTLSQETHWDAPGSAKPLNDVGEQAPTDLKLKEGWLVCKDCGQEAARCPDSGGYVHVEPADHDARVEGWTINRALFEWLLRFEPPDAPTA